MNYYSQEAKAERIWAAFFRRYSNWKAGKPRNGVVWTEKRMKMAIAYMKR